MASAEGMVTCSFSLDKDIYDAYKSIVNRNGENVKSNIINYMRRVIEYETPNAETIEAMREVDLLKADKNKKTYNSFAEIVEEMRLENA